MLSPNTKNGCIGHISNQLLRLGAFGNPLLDKFLVELKKHGKYCLIRHLVLGEAIRMLLNKFTNIIGEDVMLIPYRKEHVEKYHNWMKSEELQHLTASLPLTLEEEYEMQESWMRDENKCTFIVLDKHIYNKNCNEIDAMIGDTNLFFANDVDRMVAEVEIMIAEPESRGKHLGWQAMLLMLLYGITHLQVQQFVVKISFDNVVSIKMFEKIGFIETSRSEVFQEITFNKIVDDNWIVQLRESVGVFKLIKENV